MHEMSSETKYVPFAASMAASAFLVQSVGAFIAIRMATSPIRDKIADSIKEYEANPGT